MCCLQLSAVYCGAHFTYAFRAWCRAPVVLPQWLSQSATPPAGSPIALQLCHTGHASQKPLVVRSMLQNWDAVQVPAEQASPVPAAHCHTNAPQNPLLVHMQLWPLILSTLPRPTPTCLPHHTHTPATDSLCQSSPGRPPTPPVPGAAAQYDVFLKSAEAAPHSVVVKLVSPAKSPASQSHRQ